MVSVTSPRVPRHLARTLAALQEELAMRQAELTRLRVDVEKLQYEAGHPVQAAAGRAVEWLSEIFSRS